MDREIPKEVRAKERRKQIIKWGTGLFVLVGGIVLVLSLMQPSLTRKGLLMS